MSTTGALDGGERQRGSELAEGGGELTSPGKQARTAEAAPSGATAVQRKAAAVAAAGRVDDWSMSSGLSSALGLGDSGGSGGSSSGGSGAAVQRKEVAAPTWTSLGSGGSPGSGAQVQARGELAGGSDVTAIAAQGVASASSPLPHQEAIQQSFGKHDVSGVRAQVGGDAATASGAIGAEAYATGDRVAFAQAPDLHTAAHEAAHVVQQSHGVNLYGGVGQAGDSHERHADAVADAVVAGRSAEGMLDQYQGGASGGGGTAVQRQTAAAPAEMTPAQVQSALAWVTSSNIGAEAVREVQRVCNLDQTGTYDEGTARAVFAKQRELRMSGPDGKAGAAFFQRNGLIFTNTIVNAVVTDAILADIATRFPEGVTVAIYPNFNANVSGRAEFAGQARLFAANQRSVGVSGGNVVLGEACQIVEAGDVIEVVQSIHRGLMDRWNAQQQAASATSSAEGGMSPAEAPAYLKVKNLSLFAHGESWGMGMNAGNDFSGNGLHNNTTRGINPPNIEAFVRGLSDAVVPSVRVQLFACSTGADASRTSYQEWTDHGQGDRRGGDSMAASMATALGPEATVSAHTTVGHTTENYAARVFGAEAGEGAGGMTLFDSMYPESFIQSELTRLFPDQDEAGRAARHHSLREQMWSHFKDAITGEHGRAARDHRYPVPMGQETFVNPGHARELLYADWTANWIPTRLRSVTAAPAPRAR